MTGPQFSTVTPTDADVVHSTIPGRFYRCPDVPAVDANLHRLSTDFLGPHSNLTESCRALYEADRDRLLDERTYLQMFSTEEAA